MTDITTLAGLQAMTGDLGGTYVLLNDIDASATSTWNGGLGFEPVGTLAVPFTGSFDGGGHAITGLFVNRPATDYVGLFGSANSGSAQTIRDVTLAAANITGKSYVGALAGFKGYLYGVSNAHSSGSVTGSGTTAYYVGGLIGMSGTSGQDNTHEVANCSSSATVSANASAGGLCGQARGLIRQCFATGSVTATLASTSLSVGIGGLVGTLSAGTAGGPTRVSLSFAAGNVTGTGKMGVGGLIGWTGGSGSVYNDISACYATGAVAGTNGTQTCYAGGFVGKTSAAGAVYFHGCHAIGAVTGTAAKGGFVGLNQTAQDHYKACFWDAETSGLAQGYGENALGSGEEITGLTAAQMGGAANFPTNSADGTFTNWNTTEWAWDAYPKLCWHEPAPVAQFWTLLSGATQTFS
jgi:hypothetical protein